MSAFDQFLKAFPDYARTQALDNLRARRLQPPGQAPAGLPRLHRGGLHAASQVREHALMLSEEVLGNPHSVNPSSMEMTRRVEQARQAVLRHFNAERDYTAIFTLNASGALKLVGESYPFAPGGQLLLTADNHNSVNGMREFAQAKGAAVAYAPLTRPELRPGWARLDGPAGPARARAATLAGLSGAVQFFGRQAPLVVDSSARSKGWQVLLDAAAFVPTNPLDLQQLQPDFVVMSFYKMFGYPTGVGCLLVRKDTLATLRRPWFGGGTVNFATVQGRMHVLSSGEAGFEDGTLNYLSIPAVELGLAHLQRVGMDPIQTRVRCLTAGCWSSCCSSSTAMASPWCACMARPTWWSAAARSR